MERFKKRLVRQYKDRHILSKQEQVIPLRGDKLVKLQLVEGEKEEGYAANWQRGKEGCDKIKRSTIEREEIFEVKKRKKSVKRILTEGEAGIGKSTFCTTLSEEWAKEQLLQQFELVLHLPLREKEIASAESVFDLLKFFHKRVDESVATEIEESDGKDVLLILDGWDELSEENCQTDSFVYGLLVGDELYDASVLLTSRPSASADLHRLPCIDRCIEIVGFDEETIAEYIESEFADDEDPTEASLLLSELERNPLVASLCTVPLNCAIVCFLWHISKQLVQMPLNVFSKRQQIPSTMTDLYKDIVFKIVLRDIHNRYPEYKKSLPDLTSFDSLPKHMQSSWWNLCEFAFLPIERDRLVFSHEELAGKVSLDESFGLLQATITPSGVGSFHFLHLTFQEYLAALHLVKQLPSTLFEYHATDVRFPIIWRFVFGIAFMPKPISVQLKSLTVEAARSFLELAEYYPLMLCHCAFEAKCGEFSTLVAQSSCLEEFMPTISYTEDVTSLYPHAGEPQNAHDCAAIVHVIAHAKPGRMVRINFRGCNLGDKGVTELADVLAMKRGELRVKELWILGNGLTSKGFAALISRPTKDAFQHTVVSLSFTQNKIEDVSSLKYVLPPSSSSCLQYLNLSHNRLSMSSLQMLADAIFSDKLANLEELYLEGCLTRDPHFECNVAVVASLAHCPQLVKLNLSGNNLGVEEAQTLGQVVSQLTQDKETFDLEVDSASLDDMCICAFTQSIRGICKFSLLSFKDNIICGDGALSLANSVTSGALTVEFFVLSNNPLGLGGAVAVAKILSPPGRRISLWVQNCKLTTPESYHSSTGSVEQQLCQMPQILTDSFESLDLSGNSFTGENVGILAAFMWLYPRLERSECSHCNLTSADLENLLFRLSQLLSTSKQQLALEYWELGDNDIDDSGMATLIDHLPLFPNLSAFTFYTNPAAYDSQSEVQELLLESGAHVQITHGGIFVGNDSEEEYTSSYETISDSLGGDDEEGEVDSELETQDDELLSVSSVSPLTKEHNSIQPVLEALPQVSISSVPPESAHTQPQESPEMMKRDFEAFADVSDGEVSAATCWMLDKVHPTLDGSGITIAILDSGVHLEHEAFAGKQFKGMNFVPSQGKDTHSKANKPPPHDGGGSKANKPPPSWRTATDSHGSMAAFVAGGKGFVAKCVGTTIGEIPVEKCTVELDRPRTIPSGVAPGATLLICRVSEPYTSTAVVNTLEKLIELNEGSLKDKEPKLTVDIVSMSFGMEYDPNDKNHKKISAHITTLKQQGVICVAAVGNYGGYQSGALFPANEGDVISVGALTKKGKIADSNPKDSSSVDVYAPGENIPMPLVHPGIVNGVAYSKGSSCATPAVAGIVALLLQFDREKEELLCDDPEAAEIFKRNYRDFNYLKNTVLKVEMKRGDPDILHPYKYFKENCRLPKKCLRRAMV